VDEKRSKWWRSLLEALEAEEEDVEPVEEIINFLNHFPEEAEKALRKGIKTLGFESHEYYILEMLLALEGLSEEGEKLLHSFAKRMLEKTFAEEDQEGLLAWVWDGPPLLFDHPSFCRRWIELSKEEEELWNLWDLLEEPQQKTLLQREDFWGKRKELLEEQIQRTEEFALLREIYKNLLSRDESIKVFCAKKIASCFSDISEIREVIDVERGSSDDLISKELLLRWQMLLLKEINTAKTLEELEVLHLLASDEEDNTQLLEIIEKKIEEMI
jgi:hypothetical protein